VPRSRPAHLHLREVELAPKVELAQLVLRRIEPHNVLRSVRQVRDDPTGKHSVNRSRPPMLFGVPEESSACSVTITATAEPTTAVGV
jgi:hypothetical protein